MERAAGGRLPVMADLVSGPRTKEIGGPPGLRILAEGDLVLCDLVPRVSGYWGDSCSTFAVGEPSPAARDAHARALETLEALVAEIRPGAVAGDIDAVARGALGYPHHTGHGLGTSWHEEPRIVPNSTTVLQEGMVVALEPGTYGDDGVRLEQVVLVTGEGCEVLSGHDLDL
jgi:Xaa-Pro aminopeptidase